MNSLDLLGDIKSSTQACEIPVILYCEPVVDEIMRKVRSFGACAFVQKTKDQYFLGEGLKIAFRENEIIYPKNISQQIQGRKHDWYYALLGKSDLRI